jgi:hypothetical protein
MEKKAGYDQARDMYNVRGKLKDGMQASKPMKCNPMAAQKYDMGRMQWEPDTNRGYPKQAFDYKY